MCFVCDCLAEPSTEQQLYSRLMRHYEQDVRPTLSHTHATNVTFGFSLNQIVDVDEKNQVLTTRSWLNVNWMDRRLSWNKSIYEGIETMYVPHYKVWKPDVLLTNNADPNIKEAVMSTDVSVTYEGNITWLFAAIYRSPCLIDVRYYPFDDQTCQLDFACWSHTANEIDLQLITEKGDLSNYLNNSEFSLLDMHVRRSIEKFPCCRVNSEWPTVSVVIELRRRPLFYVFNHILPCVLISSMAILGFYMPPDTGEKVTTCITTMLSMGVYLKTITEIIPPTAEAVPLIGVYYVVSLIIVCAATVMNVFTLNIYRKGITSQQNFASRWVRKWVLGWMARVLGVHISSTRTHRHGVQEQYENVPNELTTDSADGSLYRSLLPQDVQPALFTQTWQIPSTPGRKSDRASLNASVADAVTQLADNMAHISHTLTQHQNKIHNQEKRERISLEWKQLALVTDRVLLIVFFVATSITTYIFLIQPVMNSESLGL